MTDKSHTVAELESAIRDLINAPRKKNSLLKDSAYWNMLCSCLDAIGDTELALDAYAAVPDPKEDGALYILVYGTLQALFVQQDAVENLAESLGIEPETDPLLKQIREVRNDAIGHPTKRGPKKGYRYNFISRITMSKKGFQLMTTYPDMTPPTFRSVSIPEIISTQRGRICNVLSHLIIELEREEMNHKNQFKQQKLRDIFHHTLGYNLSRLSEASVGNVRPAHEQTDFSKVEKTLTDFKAALDERGLAGAYTGVECTLELLEYPMVEIKRYFEDPQSSRLNGKDLYIFVAYISTKFDELQDMAEEIDSEYASTQDAI
ncbi:MAG: hypothetical protein DRJ61_11375 [Acidobacteria bacterium]|nr:MAG: hypothetical protein DRJ61_11375 [Acidobacteriota bacterium]